MEARAQLQAMQADGKVKSARVFSPTQANRERLAADFRDRFGMDIVAVASAEQAVADADLILAAVKSTEPVLSGRWLRPGCHVNSVGLRGVTSARSTPRLSSGARASSWTPRKACSAKQAMPLLRVSTSAWMTCTSSPNS